MTLFARGAASPRSVMPTPPAYDRKYSSIARRYQSDGIIAFHEDRRTVAMTNGQDAWGVVQVVRS